MQVSSMFALQKLPIKHSTMVNGPQRLCLASGAYPCNMGKAAVASHLVMVHQRSSNSTKHSSQIRAYNPGEYHGAAASPSNLGVLQRVVEQDPAPEDPYGMQRVSPDSFSSRGFYTDGTSIFSSLLLLLVLLTLTFQRILGLDRFITKAFKDWKERREYERRNDVIKARQSLEDNWTEHDS